MVLSAPVHGQEPSATGMPAALEAFFRLVDETDAAIAGTSETEDTTARGASAGDAIDRLLATPPDACFARAHGRYLLFLGDIRLIAGIIAPDSTQDVPDFLHERYWEHINAFRTDRQNALIWCLEVSPQPTPPPPPSPATS